MEEMDTIVRPKVLFLGNGLRLLFGDDLNWKKFLDTLSNGEYNDLDKTDIPLNLQAVLVSNNKLNVKLKEAKTQLYGKPLEGLSEFIRKIVDIGFDYIITTNYSYEIESALSGKEISNEKPNDKYLEGINKSIKIISGKRVKAEGKYATHTANFVNYNGKKIKIFHIHGEARKPSSIVIGFQWYANVLGKLQKTIKNRKNSYENCLKKGIGIKMQSWIDAFILGDVYVLGFGYDYSEIDMWWALERKHNEKAEHGKLIYYAMPPENDTTKATYHIDIHKHKLKMKLLGCYDAEVVAFEGNTKGVEYYNDFYEFAYNDMKVRLLNK